MKCECCETEVLDGKKFCPYCGMPIIDYAVKPDAEKIMTTIELGKKNLELKPAVEALKKKKEEEQKKKEEKLNKMIKDTSDPYSEDFIDDDYDLED